MASLITADWGTGIPCPQSPGLILGRGTKNYRDPQLGHKGKVSLSRAREVLVDLSPV